MRGPVGIPSPTGWPAGDLGDCRVGLDARRGLEFLEGVADRRGAGRAGRGLCRVGDGGARRGSCRMNCGTVLNRCRHSVSAGHATRAIMHCLTWKRCAGSTTCCTPGIQGPHDTYTVPVPPGSVNGTVAATLDFVDLAPLRVRWTAECSEVTVPPAVCEGRPCLVDQREAALMACEQQVELLDV